MNYPKCSLAELPSRITASIQRNPLIAEVARIRVESPIQTLMRMDTEYVKYHEGLAKKQ